MNLRKIKLALTVDLLNKSGGNSSIQSVKEFMIAFKNEVGNFIGQTIIKHLQLSQALVHQTISIQYEHLTLHINFVNNISTSSQYIQGFSVR